MSPAQRSGHVFLSYRSLDADFALRLAANLKNAGVRVWMDRLDGIVVGARSDSCTNAARPGIPLLDGRCIGKLGPSSCQSQERFMHQSLE